MPAGRYEGSAASGAERSVRQRTALTSQSNAASSSMFEDLVVQYARCDDEDCVTLTSVLGDPRPCLPAQVAQTERNSSTVQVSRVILYQYA